MNWISDAIALREIDAGLAQRFQDRVVLDKFCAGLNPHIGRLTMKTGSPGASPLLRNSRSFTQSAASRRALG